MPLKKPKLQPMPRVKLTLRDYFAARAMQGILANLHTTPKIDATELSRVCFQLAGEMLKEGRKNGWIKEGEIIE